MPSDIRVLNSAADLNEALTVFYTSLVGYRAPSGAQVHELFEPGRCLGISDGGRIVATATSFTSWLAVPGGTRVPHCAVTDVGVLPTHTRRGLGQTLIRHQIQDAAARGEVVATLRASEATIYERFGYGVATSLAAAEVTTAAAAFRPTVAPGGKVRLTDPATSWDLLASIYAPLNRPGAIDRPAYWWRSQQYGASQRPGPAYVVVHGEPGAEDGFARYRPARHDEWFSAAERSIVVDDLVARNDEAYRGLLRFLLGVDLVEKVVFPTLPVDHAIGTLLSDPRAVRTTGLRDETWLRLIDVQAALEARSYRGPGSVVLGVTDPLLPANTGSFLVSTAGVQRTDSEPELVTDVSALAAAYLGGTPWWQLARAGRVTEFGAGILETADRLFATPRAPHCGTSF
jgi:predicted acetyltransferase